MKKITVRIIVTLLITIIFYSCSYSKKKEVNNTETNNSNPTETQQSESDRLNAFFEENFNQEMSQNPEMQTFFGMKENDDKWNDYSDEASFKAIEFARKSLAEMQTNFDYDKLTLEAQMSYRLFKHRAKATLDSEPWVYHSYPVNQEHGLQAWLPVVLISAHTISSVDDANNYIARLNGLEQAINQIIEKMEIRNAKGIIPPKFVFPYVYSDIANLLKGKPFTENDENSPLYNDFINKVSELDIDDKTRSNLIKQASDALISATGPAFEALDKAAHKQEKIANDDDGVWKLPNGEAYYRYTLKMHTSSDKTAADLHSLGLAEVARIHDEIRSLMKKTGFEGDDMKAFFKFMEGDQFFYPNTDKGRVDYFKRTEDVVDSIRAKLDDYFLTKPKAKMIVKRVEPFMEESGGIAFYNPPAMDGSRPGIYYTNLHDMTTRPIYNIETIAYHEGTPGHHMQSSISQELEGIPMFRRMGDYTAYGEGWGLYAEWLGKDMGFFQDPYSDFGRLNQELWRAVRLVVDTGIHAKKWTRQQVIDYHVENTPNPYVEIVKETERYILLPGQATSYKIGMIKIQELRAKAISELGENFDIRKFHDVILTSGAVPLNVMEENVLAWIEITGKNIR